MCRRVTCLVLVFSTVCGGLPPGVGNLLAVEFSRNPFRRKTCVEKLACSLDELEKRVGLYGSIVAKGPDVWGQARLTRHRDEFEKQMAQQLDKFDFTLNGELARSDQSYLLQALTLAATINAANNPGGAGNSATTNVASASAAPSNGAQNPADILDTGDTKLINRSKPNELLSSVFPGATGTNNNFYLAVEPEVLLDQRARYLNHLHQLRRINEGDDNADSPGYSLNLVRIPVSVLPGDRTREGYGAEITITARSHFTDEMLADTFRALVINDLVDQLALPITQFIDWTWDHLARMEQLSAELEEAQRKLVEAQAARELAEALKNLKKTPDNPKIKSLVANKYGASLKGLNIDEAIAKFEPKAQNVEILQEKMRLQRAALVKEEQEFDKSVARAKLALRTAQAGLSPRERRSRYAIPTSQILPVFGSAEIEELAKAAFNVRDRYQCETRPNRLRLTDIQSFLRGELDAACEYLTRHPYRLAGQQSLTARGGTPGLWSWVNRGGYPAQLVAAIRSTMNVDRERGDFYSAAHDRTFGRNDLGVDRRGRPYQIQNTAVRNRPPLIRPASFEDDGTAQEPVLAPSTAPRLAWIDDDANTGSSGESSQTAVEQAQNPTEALAWAVVVESVLLNEQLKEDIQRVSQDPDCGCQGIDDNLWFYLPNPGDRERQLFIDYVRCRWPIHVFALDPVAQQQNIADTYALRRETQIALAVAFTGGNISGKSLTRYMRHIEEDMRTIELNDTIVGFGHGTDTFGWRFFPRFQSPPIESNMTVFGRDLLWGGPSRNAQLRKQRIEQGMRECTAIVIMPSFVRHVTFETRSNWFALANCDLTCRSDTGAKLLNTVEWSHDIRCMEEMAQCAYMEENMYRAGEIDRLRNRVHQLSQRLPMQTMHSQVPYENTLGGFEMFSSGVTDLAPELVGYYGSPGVDPSKPTDLFLVGNHFSVHDTQVIAGNMKCETNLLSRQVMRVTIPAGVRVETRREKPDGGAAVDPSATGSAAAPVPETMTTAPSADSPCPAPDDPCCSKKYVEIRLATPYGIAGQLHIPVVAPAECEPDLQWSPQNYPLVYYWKQSGTDPFTVAYGDILARPPYKFAIKVSKNVVLPGSAVGIDLAIAGDSGGINPIASLTSIAFDARNGQYSIDAANFATLHKNLCDAVVQGILQKINPNAPPSDYVVELQATINVDAATKVPVKDTLTIPIHFEKKR